jgi:DNA-binding MarR family transcriptional regulator
MSSEDVTRERKGNSGKYPVDRSDIHVLSEHIARLSLAMEGLAKAAPTEATSLAAHHARAAMHLFRHDGATVSDLAEAMSISLGWASRIADDLENLGYLTRIRDSEDRRVVRLRLTSAAANMADEMYQKRGGMVSAVLEQFSSGERNIILSFLDSMSTQLENAVTDRISKN